MCIESFRKPCRAGSRWQWDAQSTVDEPEERAARRGSSLKADVAYLTFKCCACKHFRAEKFAIWCLVFYLQKTVSLHAFVPPIFDARNWYTKINITVVHAVKKSGMGMKQFSSILNVRL
jgi:hypothetical protein